VISSPALAEGQGCGILPAPRIGKVRPRR
jgi:hypothetical protein